MCEKVEIASKETIDPVIQKQYPDITYNMTSDEAFGLLIKECKKYDIIFIDGLHTSEQVDKDIVNSLKVLSEGGIIVLHDCNPASMFDIKPEVNGTTFRSIINLRYSRPDLTVHTVNTDCGCGIVSVKNTQKPYNKVDIDIAKKFGYFSNNRRELLNLLSTEEFKSLY